MDAQVSRTMNASPERVFAELSDGWTYTSWVVGAMHMRDVDPTWPKEGARLHHRVGVWPIGTSDTTQVLECEPPHRLVLQARGWPAGEARIVFTLEADGAGACTVTMDEWPTHGPGRMMRNALGSALIRQRNRETLERLACRVENRPLDQPA